MREDAAGAILYAAEIGQPGESRAGLPLVAPEMTIERTYEVGCGARKSVQACLLSEYSSSVKIKTGAPA